MRDTYYNTLKDSIPGFDHIYLEKVLIKDLEFDSVTSQIRKDGHVIAKVPAMAADMKQNGQKTPVSHITNLNGRKILIEGATRVLGGIENGDEYIVSNTYIDQQNLNGKELYEWQISQNNHRVSTSHSKSDIKDQVQSMHTKKYIDDEVGFSYKSDPVGWLEKAIPYIQSLYDGQVTKANVESYLKRALEGVTTDHYTAYTKSSAMLKFKNQLLNLGIDWNPEKSGTAMVGEVSKDKTFYAIANTPQFKTNFVGNVTWKVKSHPNLSVGVVCWKSELLGATPERVFNYYDKMIQLYKELASMSDWHASWLTGGLYALPAIKTGKYSQDMNEVIDLLAWNNPLKAEGYYDY
tara:strand:- start:2006 stop:3055 length:1050 start_codon:yes stop_codon:yes gene_type:complete